MKLFRRPLRSRPHKAGDDAFGVLASKLAGEGETQLLEEQRAKIAGEIAGELNGKPVRAAEFDPARGDVKLTVPSGVITVGTVDWAAGQIAALVAAEPTRVYATARGGTIALTLLTASTSIQLHVAPIA